VQLAAGLCQAKERVAAVASDIAAGAIADFALGDLAAHVVFGSVGVRRQLRPVEHHQQGGFVGVQPVQGGNAGLAVENVTKGCAAPFSNGLSGRRICPQPYAGPWAPNFRSHRLTPDRDRVVALVPAIATTRPRTW